jgi:large subunit ribosomal protein L29|tara:strand:- start:380 stop:574 length:195 start_codon:yes stop_codon:yes gene_type:complete
MAFSKIEKLNTEELEKTVLETSQQLVELRLKKVTRQAFKPHEFKHAKRKLAQLLTLQNSQNKAN